MGWACSCLAPGLPAWPEPLCQGSSLSLEQVASLRASVPILPPPPHTGQLLAAGQCSGSQWQEHEQLEQALAAPGNALSDAVLCSDPFRGAGLQGPWGMDSPSATVAWEPTLGCAGRGWPLSYHRLQWEKSSEKEFKILFLSLCGRRQGRNGTGGSRGGEG